MPSCGGSVAAFRGQDKLHSTRPTHGAGSRLSPRTGTPHHAPFDPPDPACHVCLDNAGRFERLRRWRRRCRATTRSSKHHVCRTRRADHWRRTRGLERQCQLGFGGDVYLHHAGRLHGQRHNPDVGWCGQLHGQCQSGWQRQLPGGHDGVQHLCRGHRHSDHFLHLSGQPGFGHGTWCFGGDGHLGPAGDADVEHGQRVHGQWHHLDAGERGQLFSCGQPGWQWFVCSRVARPGSLAAACRPSISTSQASSAALARDTGSPRRKLM